MNLFLFPESPILTNGYGIVVNSDYNLLEPKNSDIVIWYTNSKENPKYKEFHYILKRPGVINFKRFRNMLFLKAGSEVDIQELKFLENQKFESIFCGDVLFYRAIRKLFPQSSIIVRFHNCFSRILDRQKLLKIDLDLKFKLDLYLTYKLEQEIFLDKNVRKLFLSEEDKAYYCLMTKSNDADIWGIDVDHEKIKRNRINQQPHNNLIWFGGVQSHKKKSLLWFINDIYPKVKEEIPNVEFHLWGNKTEQFKNEKLNIYGHGVFSDNEFPVKDQVLYVNPDIIGGGVKIKLKTYLEAGIPFITTPFGYEGYKKEYIDNDYCIVREPENWVKSIIELLKIP